MSSEKQQSDSITATAPLEIAEFPLEIKERFSLLDSKKAVQSVYPTLELERIEVDGREKKGVKTKRTRSADSPRDSDEDKQLTTYHSTEQLPEKKKNKLIEQRDLLKTALIDTFQAIKTYKVQLETTQSSKQTKELQLLIKNKDIEYKLLSEKLYSAEQKVRNLEIQGIELVETTNLTKQVVQHQAQNLANQLEQTLGEKSNLISTLEKKTRTVVNL